MATTPDAQALPMFYKDLVPLNSKEHANWKVKGLDNASFMQTQHAVPITSDEFANASRNYPIVFSVGENSVPLILMGLNEGVNTFMDDEGRFSEPAYVPAYVRRYPFMLAKLRPDAEELSLCFDPTTDAIGDAHGRCPGNTPSRALLLWRRLPPWQHGATDAHMWLHAAVWLAWRGPSTPFNRHTPLRV